MNPHKKKRSKNAGIDWPSRIASVWSARRKPSKIFLRRISRCSRLFRELETSGANIDAVLFLLQSAYARNAEDLSRIKYPALIGSHPDYWSRVSSILEDQRKKISAVPQWDNALDAICSEIKKVGLTRKLLRFEVRNIREGHASPFSAETIMTLSPGIILAGFATSTTGGRPNSYAVDRFAMTAWLIREMVNAPPWAIVSQLLEKLFPESVGKTHGSEKKNRPTSTRSMTSQNTRTKWLETRVNKFKIRTGKRNLELLRKEYTRLFSK